MADHVSVRHEAQIPSSLTAFANVTKVEAINGFAPFVEKTKIASEEKGLPRSPEFAIRETRISAFAMRENNDMRLPWYDSPTG